MKEETQMKNRWSARVLWVILSTCVLSLSLLQWSDVGLGQKLVLLAIMSLAMWSFVAPRSLQARLIKAKTIGTRTEQHRRDKY